MWQSVICYAVWTICSGQTVQASMTSSSFSITAIVYTQKSSEIWICPQSLHSNALVFRILKTIFDICISANKFITHRATRDLKCIVWTFTFTENIESLFRFADCVFAFKWENLMGSSYRLSLESTMRITFIDWYAFMPLLIHLRTSDIVSVDCQAWAL